MKKLLFIFLFFVCVGFCQAQTIQNKNHSSTGFIKSDGTIQDKNHSTSGYIKSDGTIQDKNHSTIGYIKIKQITL